MRKALGSGVGWVGRDVRLAEVRAGQLNAPRRLLGGTIRLAATLALTDVSLRAIVLPDPITWTIRQWAAVEADPEHPDHAVPHTFTLREVLEENHPFRATITNPATRLLALPDRPATAPQVMETLRELAFLIGHVDHPAAFAAALGEALGVAPDAVPAAAFSLRRRAVPTAEMRRLLMEANHEDYRLIAAVRALAADGTGLVRTDRL